MRLTVVGLGPGDPELITIKGVRAIEAAELVFVPRSRDNEASRALQIAHPWLDLERQRVVYLTMPMTRDSARLQAAWQETAARMVEHFGNLAAEQQRDDLRGVYLLLGDPLLYGTFTYIWGELAQHSLQIDVEIVPGVTSFAAAAARAHLPLSTRDERVAIVPAAQALDAEELGRMCAAFETLILMKVGGVLPGLIEMLESLGLLERAIYAEHVGLPGEQIVYDVATLRGQRRPYLSLLLVRRGG